MNKKISEKFLSPYNPTTTEEGLYKKWLEAGSFSPVDNPDKEPFSIVLPPPNVTGTLHLGHSLMVAVEDTVVRFKRMQGHPTTWIPGTDHASIATESKVAKILQKEGIRRHDLGREAFLKRVNEFALESQDTILSQIKALGASLDWSKLAYTLDDTRQKAVTEAFVRMHNAGLLVKGNRVVNWDPKGQTVISDDEIVYEEGTAILYTFRYSKDFPIPISTTRPETKIGDVAVAVHPDDTRYKEYVGKTFTIEDFCGTTLTLKVIADKDVDPEFGTGALGVTPAHSLADFDMAEQHELPLVQVIDERAKMMCGSIEGLKTREAREAVAAWLREQGLMEKEEAISQNLSTAERTGGIIEPLPKEQWFVAVNKPFTIPHSEIKGIESGSTTTLKEIMLKAVEGGQISVLPERFEKTYFHWVKNLRDWCISRQIWFGHRIPAWYKGGKVYVGHEAPQGEGWEQDTDTLDTWFSSGLWTFSTLGWPEETEDLQRFHPTDLLETGYDILPFWVARMILMSGFHLGQVPFKTVYLHGLVRDEKGRKVSKSLGNTIDPRDMIAKYGADALRMSLLVGVGPGSDSNIGENKIKAYKKFANKLWNISRFVLENAPEDTSSASYETLDEKSRELLTQVENLSQEVTDDLENYRFHLASEKLYAFVWHEFADKILEEAKPRLAEGDKSAKLALFLSLQTLLKLLHPFMPFITEEVWQSGAGDGTLLVTSLWPTTSSSHSSSQSS